MAPFTQFEQRINQFDICLTKFVKLGRARTQGNFDLYNVFNANPVLAVNTTYGPAWLTPLSVLDARLFKVGAQIEF